MRKQAMVCLSVAGLLFTLIGANAMASEGLTSEQWLELGIEPGEVEALRREEQAPATGVLRGGTVIPATLIIEESDVPAGLAGPVIVLNAPFTNSLGQVGFVGGAEDGTGGTDRFIWFNDAVLFLDSSVTEQVLSGGEGAMGIGDQGQFVYSPAIDGSDGLWTHNGLLAIEDTQAPAFPPGTNSTFHSRPSMTPDGTAFWVAGFNETGGTSTEGRVLYRALGSGRGSIDVLLQSDDVIDGLTIDRPTGIDFDYDFSNSGQQFIGVVFMNTGSTADDGTVVVNGGVVAREDQVNGTGDNWDNFDLVSINNRGTFAFSGDTNGSTASDEFIAVNGSILIREGGTVGPVTLATTATVRALSLNDQDHLVHIWNISGGTEVLFFSCRAAQADTKSEVVLTTGDSLDFDGDGIGDATVTDFNATLGVGPGLSLADNGQVYVELDIDRGSGELEAIVRLDLPSCPDAVFEDRFESD
ncbi:MAG: hypothetical protein AAGJ52_12265 [Pseudomonadota bacterium]